MGIRIDSQDAITFGIAATAVPITHVRFRRASDDGQPVIVALPNTVNILANRGMRIPSGMFDLVYKAGPFGNAHMLALVEGYWGQSGSRTNMEVDLMTSSSSVVAVAGYSQQSYENWIITEEAD